MKRVGCAVAVVGAVLCVAALALWIVTGIRSTQARRVASIALPIGRAVRSDFIRVDPKRPCSISASVNVRSKNPGISFPLRYSVLDASGAVLSSARTVVGDRTRAVWTSRTLMGGPAAWYHLEYGFDSFDVKPPGMIRIEAQLDADTRREGRRVEDLTLIVYDHASDQKNPVVAGTILFVAGAVAGGVGIVMVIVGASRGKDPRGQESEATTRSGSL